MSFNSSPSIFNFPSFSIPLNATSEPISSAILTNPLPRFLSNSIGPSAGLFIASLDNHLLCEIFETLELQLLLLLLLLLFVVPLKTLGNSRTRPARIEGMQAQNTAAVVSRVDQKIVGTLFQVGSAVSPKFLRV